MAEIVNLSVFTNEGGSCTNTDLLQQSFQDVIDEDDINNDFVAFFFEDENGIQQSIRLTRAQATALGLTFEIDQSTDEKSNEINYQQEQDHLLNDIQSVTDQIKSNQDNEIITQIEFPVNSEWIHDSDNLGDTINNQTLINNQNSQLSNEIIDIDDNIDKKSMKGFIIQNMKILNKKTNQEIQTQHHQHNQTSIQRLPVLLPPHFIIKPAQTVLKSGKNIKLITGTNKIPISNTSALTNTSENSLLFQKSQLINNINSINKNSQITSQLINGNSMANGTNGQIRLSPLIKTSNIQRNNSQQFYNSITKTSEQLRNSKSQISNCKNNITPSLIKTAVPAQIIRNTNIVKTSLNNQQKSLNSQFIFKTTPKLKTQDLKTVLTNGSSIRQNTISSSPVSILKPQPKVAFTNSNKQNLISPTTKIIKQVAISPPRPTERKIVQNQLNSTNLLNNTINQQCLHNNIVKPVENGVAGINGTVGTKIVKKITKNPKLNFNAGEKIETEKTTNGTDNTIQIVQQGHTFHSTQKLTQNQLRQIAQALQQRGHQESLNPNEKIVYRVVFPEELDLGMRNPNNLLKGRRGKRGRPKKTLRRPVTSIKTGMTDEETEEAKEERKKVGNRTRSGRVSRPPKHMVSDYKHLHPIDFLQPDMDDSDGGYSDYNTNTILNGKIDDDEKSKELLTGLGVPKRKVSTNFQCSTCNKVYIGRTRMGKHYESHPDHGKLDPLPSTNDCPDGEIKKSPSLTVDPFKRKGKKRGPWAYVTPEAKSERRQTKLREALSVCDSGEISKIAAKPVVNAQSLFDLMVIKSDNNVRLFLNELKILMEKIREQAGIMLSPIIDKEKDENLIDLSDELLCDALGLASGIYSVNDEVFKKQDPYLLETSIVEEPPNKLQKICNDEGKENIEERLSSGFSEGSDLSVSDFLVERKNETNCPEVLTALTLMPRNPSPIIESNKNNISKLLISSPQIQRQISDNQGFQKVEINSSKNSIYRKIEPIKEGFTKLTDGLDITNCSQVFTKLDNNFEQTKIDTTQAFIKLEPMQQNFIKLENNIYSKDEQSDLTKIDNNYHNLNDTQNFTKGFQKIISKIIPINSDDNCEKNEILNNDKNINKIDNLPILQDTEVPMINSNCDGGIFGSTDNLDQISHLDYSVVMDKHLIMDNLVDELVSERLKNIMPDSILENNLMPNSTNLDTELDFEALSEEFNRNTNS